jgi:hypothetical protein
MAYEVYTGDIDVSPIVLNDSVTIYPDNRQGTLALIPSLPPGASVDDLFYFSVSGDYYERVIDGPFRAVCANIVPGSDQTTLLQTVLNDSRISTLLFDIPGGASITVNGSLTIPAGKVIQFTNENILTGTGTITVNGKIEAGFYQVFDTSLTIAGINKANTPLYPEWWGATGDGSTNDSAAFTALFSSCNTDFPIIVYLRGVTYLLSNSVAIPALTTSENYIELLGNSTTLKTTSAISILSRLPANQTQAGSDINTTVIKAYDIIFQGNGTSGQNGLVIGATYGSVIKNCKFRNLDIGLDLQFCLNATIEQCYGFSNSTYTFIARSGQWTGATGNNSQSNSSAFYNCRDYCKTGQTASFYIQNSNSVKLDNCITEGANPVTNISFDSSGSTTVQYFTINNLHGENTPSGQCIKILGNAPFVRIISPFIQVAQILVEVAAGSAGNGVIQIEDINYWVTNLKCRNQGAFRWIFKGITDVATSFQGAAWFNNIFDTTSPYTLPAARFLSYTTNAFDNLTSTIQLRADGQVNFVGGGNFVNQKTLFHRGAAMYLDQNSSQFIQFSKAGQALTFIGSDAGFEDYALFITANTFRVRKATNGVIESICLDEQGKVGINKTNPGVGMDIGWTDAIGLPGGTTAQRPTGATRYLRYNSDNNTIEWYNGTAWISPITSMPQEFKANIRTITTNASVASDDYTLLVDSSAGNVTITVDSSIAKRVINVKKISSDANTVTITPTSGSIDGSASFAFTTQWQNVQLQSNGTNLFIL